MSREMSFGKVVSRFFNSNSEAPMGTTTKTKFADFGPGWFDEKHREALAAIPDAQIYAFCTRTE